MIAPATRALAAAAAALLLLAIHLAPAASAQGIHSFETAVGYEDCTEILDFPPAPSVELPAGSTAADAGAHRDVCLKFDLGVERSARTIQVDAPPGLIANPNAVEQKCPASAVTADARTVLNCPVESQVGTAAVKVIAGTFPGAVFMVESGPTQPARLVIAFALVVPSVSVTVEARTESDFGITTISPEVNDTQPLEWFELFLWGVPNANQRGGISTAEGTSPVLPPAPPAQQRAFWTNPTVCDESKLTRLEMTFYLPPLGPDTATSEDPTPTNCEAVPFEPSLDLAPTSSRADDSSGLEVDLSLPQTMDPTVLGTSHLRRAEVTLPEGTTFNGSAADGLEACTDEQFKLGTREPAECPDAAKIGSLEFDVPLLEGPLKGSVYLGKPLSTDPQSGRMFRVFQVAQGFGLDVKIAGYAKADPATGRIVAVFGDPDLDGQLDPGEGLPQVPFSNVHMSFKGGPRGVLATPQTCGTKTTEALLTPYSDPGNPVAIADSFEIAHAPNGLPCPATLAERPFEPGMSAGLIDPIAGRSSPFAFRLTRPDGHQEIASLELDLPPGLTAKLAGVPRCGDAALAAAAAPSRPGLEEIAGSACPAASQVGVATVGAGAGASPFYARTGKAYLAGPYRGAPLSLAAIVPAVAGPFDLGSVVVRNRVLVDPDDAQVHVVSDPLPQILSGIPIRVRDIRVAVDRPDFMRAPTNCEAMALGARVTGAQGRVASPSNRFQVGNCAALAFKPRLYLRLKGGTKRGDNPALTAVVDYAGNEANIKKASVALPHSAFLDQSHIKTICTRVLFAADACPKGSVYGFARAFSPLLDQPLEGPVYLRSSDNPLPDLVAALHGEVDIDLAGRIDSVNGGIRTTFANAPDASVSKFVLQMQGGKKGLLVNSRDICKHTYRATAKITAHNGKRANQRPVLRSDCGGKAGKKGKH